MAFPSKALTQLTGSNGPVHALAYSSSPSTYILSGSSDRSIRLYNPSRAPAAASRSGVLPPKPTQLIQTYTAHGHEVLDLAIARDNATFVSCGGDRAVYLWDVATAKTLRRFAGSNGHEARVNAVVWAGENSASLLVSGSFDRSVRVWDVRNSGGASGGGGGKPVMVLSDAKDSISAVVTGEGLIGSGSVDGRVRWYDVRMGMLETDVLGSPVTSLQRTRDGRGYLVGTLGSGLRLMDRETGACLKTYRAEGWSNEEFRVRSCFGGNERWVLCGNEGSKGAHGEVYVWDTVTGEVVQKVPVEGGLGPVKRRVGSDGKEKERVNVISCVAWKEDGRGDQWCCAGTDGLVTVFG